jgi:two-component system chemotaxis response regulator CheB
MIAEPSAVRVLIVDDSAMIRKVLTMGLSRDPDIEVIGTASNAAAAEAFLSRETPDVVTLDIEMPGLDGLSFLKTYLRDRPVATVVISGHSGRGTDIAIEALRAGAVDVIAKPTVGVGSGLDTIMADVAASVKAAARSVARPGARMHREALMRAVASRPAQNTPSLRLHPKDWLFAIGASTGGVRALSAVLESFGPDIPGIVIVQHMPEDFTNAFARRLNGLCRIEVREAAEGDRVEPGLALIAPGGLCHMSLVRMGDDFRVRLTEGPPVCFSRPSVDVLFNSVAVASRGRATGMILTGMGRDGSEGLRQMRASGARTFAQDEASSTVYGMPLAAWENGAAEDRIPLDRVADTLLRSVGQGARGPGDRKLTAAQPGGWPT